MKLSDLQKTFAEALVHPKSFAEDAKWRARGDTAFTGNDRVTPIGQLDIYREQFWIRHVNCLREDFPVLVALVGDEKFEAIVADYLAAYPPKKFQLRHLGENLAAFLATSRPPEAARASSEARDDTLLADLARVEWAFIDAFDAPDAPPLDPTTIAAIAEDDWPNARLELHPSLQLLRLAHAANQMRDAWWADKEKRPIERVPREATTAVVYRHKMLLYTEVMDALPFEMLSLLSNGKSLGDAGDVLAASHPDRAGDIESSIGEWFTRWSALGWISRVVL